MFGCIASHNVGCKFLKDHQIIKNCVIELREFLLNQKYGEEFGILNFLILLIILIRKIIKKIAHWRTIRFFNFIIFKYIYFIFFRNTNKYNTFM